MLSTYRLRSKKTILTLIMVAMTCISAGRYLHRLCSGIGE